MHIALVGGEVDLLLLVRARDNHDLRRVVLEQLQSIPSVRSTKTWLIFEDFDPSDERAPRPARAADSSSWLCAASMSAFASASG